MAVKNISIFIVCLGFLQSKILAQVGIGTSSPNSTAAVDVSSTSKGTLFPRLTNTQMLAISNPAQGLQVFNTSSNTMYYYSGSQWLSCLNSFKKYANAGVTVQFDNLQIQMTTSGNRSFQIRTVSGTSSISGTSKNIYITTSAGTAGSASYVDGYTRQAFNLSTTYTYWQSSADFPMHGSTQEILLIDHTNLRAYRIICTVGSGYNNNFFEIERLK